MQEWAEVERRAAACHTKTGTYIRHMAVHGQMIFYDMEKFVPVLNGMRIISNNINQIARKANETNSIYAGDVEKLKEEVQSLSHLLLKAHSFKTYAITSFYPPATNNQIKPKTKCRILSQQERT